MQFSEFIFFAQFGWLYQRVQFVSKVKLRVNLVSCRCEFNHSTKISEKLVILFIFMQRSNSFWLLKLEIPVAKLTYSGQKFHGFVDHFSDKKRANYTNLTVQVVVCVFFYYVCLKAFSNEIDTSPIFVNLFFQIPCSSHVNQPILNLRFHSFFKRFAVCFDLLWSS